MDFGTYFAVRWVVELGDEFQPEYDDLLEEVQDDLLAMTRLLQQFGPQLKRPHADTMNGSRHANMKELRFDAAGGVWRVAKPFCLSREINQAAAKNDFTENLSARRMIVTTPTLSG